MSNSNSTPIQFWEFMKKTAFITGMVGSHLADYLLEHTDITAGLDVCQGGWVVVKDLHRQGLARGNSPATSQLA